MNAKCGLESHQHEMTLQYYLEEQSLLKVRVLYSGPGAVEDHGKNSEQQ